MENPGILEKIDRKDWAILILTVITGLTGDIAYRAMNLTKRQSDAFSGIEYKAASLIVESSQLRKSSADVSADLEKTVRLATNLALMAEDSNEARRSLNDSLSDCITLQKETRGMLLRCQDIFEAKVAAKLAEAMSEPLGKVDGDGNKSVVTAEEYCDGLVRQEVGQRLSELRECAAALAECRGDEQK